MSKLEEAMLKHIESIVNKEYRPFSFRDLLRFEVDGQSYNSSHGTIRNKLSKFNKEGKIELCCIDTIAFYSLPGRKFGKDKLMTADHTDVINYNNNKHDLYKTIRKHPLYNVLKYSFGKSSLHDIQLSFQSRRLWDFLASIEYYKQRINPDNRGISFGYYQIERYLAIQVNVQNTDTVNVIVKCSTNPIMLDFDGVMRLTEALTRIEERLSAVVNDPSNKTFNAEYNPSENSVLYYINSDGTTKRVQNYMSIGSGEDVANEFCSHLIHKEITMKEFTKHAYLAIERMNYLPRSRVGVEKGKTPTIRYLEYNSENDREPLHDEINECQIYVENNMKDFKDAFFNGIKY